MAIWPFGRKSKRHTIQLDAAAVGDVQPPQEPRHSFDGAKVGRKQSKRQKNRHSHPVEQISTALNDASPDAQPTQHPSPLTSHGEQVAPMKGARDQASRVGQRPDAYTSQTTVNQDHATMSRNPSLLRSRRSDNGPAVLKKKLSKRKAYEIAREREIRMMASSPIDIPRRSAPLPGDHLSVDTRRAPRAQSRRSDRHHSDLSLSLRDSTSSISDFAESYTFKVNGFAAWTPRPVIRYVEAPRLPTAKSQKTSEGSTRKEKTPAVSVSEEDFHSKRRVDRLADDLDAGALRELLDRDRRRKERKQIEDHEKLQRKLQRTAERQRSEAELHSTSHHHHHHKQREHPGLSGVQQSRPGAESQAESDDQPGEDAPKQTETNAFPSGDSAGSWLRDSLKETGHNGRESVESVHVIGNLDDSSVQERKLGMRRSFGPSQEMGMSRSTLSPSHSPSRHGLNSPSSSQVYGIGRESTSDLSRSERRLSDHSSGRINTISSIFRRGSSRLKRRYKERFQDRTPVNPNTSHESFFKVSTQSSGPPPYVPPKPFLHSGTIKRSQSKFKEHFGDEPLSPPDSRLQSPDIPEEPADQLDMDNDNSTAYVGTQYPIPISDIEMPDAGRVRHHSWTGDSVEGDVDNVPLSQSLASIDSEGSWMSGQFLRRISQRTTNPVRPSLSSSRNRLNEGHEGSFKEHKAASNDQLVQPDSGLEASRASSNALGEHDQDFDMAQAPQPTEPVEPTWHAQVAKRPVLVNPTIRPKSNEGLLNNIESMYADEDFSPIEEHSDEFYLSKND